MGVEGEAPAGLLAPSASLLQRCPQAGQAEARFGVGHALPVPGLTF